MRKAAALVLLLFESSAHAFPSAPERAEALLTPGAEQPLPRDYAASILDPSLFNAKSEAMDFAGRHREVFSDPSNLFLPRCAKAGDTARSPSGEPIVLMHNGLAVTQHGYYDAFSDILTSNRGVHEPAEERLFSEVLMRMPPKHALMVELGSYWAYYSTWFAKALPSSHALDFEGNPSNLQVGRANAKLNGVDAQIDFLPYFVGKEGESVDGQPVVSVATLLAARNVSTIDLLHMDVQGSESSVLTDMAGWLKSGRARYVFVSTHQSDANHELCEQMLKEHGYSIIGSQTFAQQTFSEDGILVAASPAEAGKIAKVNLGSREHTKLRSAIYDALKRSESDAPCEYAPAWLK